MRLFCVGGIESVRPVVSAVEGEGRGKENRLSGHAKANKGPPPQIAVSSGGGKEIAVRG